VRLLGPLTVFRAGANLELPASRKTRALFGYLALAGEAVGRSRLCELLWELPSDPRGELRWCLSKIRAFLGPASSDAVETSGETVQLHLEEDAVDALQLAEAAKAFDRLDIDQLRAAASRFTGDFLEGLEVDRSPLFMSWLTAQRRNFRSLQTTLLEHLARRLPARSSEAVTYLEQWVQLEPTDTRVNAMLLGAFLQNERAVEGERHLHAAARLFEDAKFGLRTGSRGVAAREKLADVGDRLRKGGFSSTHPAALDACGSSRFGAPARLLGGDAARRRDAL
jgi:DNA-binding SARP family transcriptional activator